MYTAEMALYDTRNSKWTPLDDWTWFDEIQYRIILAKIRKATIKKKTFIYYSNVRVRVKYRLEQYGYKVYMIDIGMTEYIWKTKISWDNLRGE